jgi:SEC-C motif domain protein
MTCPCHSGKLYQECCAPYHLGGNPPNALLLMRSRYSAYALGKIDYILKTTHPQNINNPPKKQIKAFCDHTKFEGLTILSVEEKEPYAYVTFRAHLSQGGQDLSFTEKSEFAKIDDRWLYLKGEKT